ncbi:MAG TPA: NADH-quinone oxidoreductase subunit N [Bryobacteraceae bacterium]|nr:NADH-quinone oxidoreductase subunit N [Bryobacteraceae bacterium]
MPDSFAPSTAELVRFLPEIILTLVGTLVMVLAAVVKGRGQRGLAYVSLAGLAAALAGVVVAYADPGTAFRDMLTIDGFATFFRAVVIGVGALTVLSSMEYLRREGAESGEYYALILYSVVGQCVMVAASDLIIIFIGLEISSIASYVLAGYLRDRVRASEAAIKYFLLGSFATAFLLFGVAWLYGITGSTYLSDIRAALVAQGPMSSPILISAAAALVFVGLAFKVSAWPFQSWAPDVYEGAPTPVAAFLSAGPKAAAFAVFLRVFIVAFGPIGTRWEPLLWVCALATMVVGNFAALLQTNVKRLLAYSSIAHAGYVLVAVTARSEIGTAAAMFYLAAYALMNVGAFTVVAHVCRKGERFVEVKDLAGLGARQPVTAALFSIFLLSLIGVPLTGGFFGKFYIFRAALHSDLIWLTVLGLLTSAVAAYYYLRVIVVMYMQEPAEATADLPPLGGALGASLWLSALGTLLLGIFPSLILDFAAKSALLAR